MKVVLKGVFYYIEAFSSRQSARTLRLPLTRIRTTTPLKRCLLLWMCRISRGSLGFGQYGRFALT